MEEKSEHVPPKNSQGRRGITRRAKIKQPSLGNGSMLVDASPLVSRAPMRAKIEPFKPKPDFQPKLFTGELLPEVVIPKPPPKKSKKRIPKEQLSLFGGEQNG